LGSTLSSIIMPGSQRRATFRLLSQWRDAKERHRPGTFSST
jgi:hypothetical protein